MTTIKNFLRIVDAQTITITVLAVCATFGCRYYGIQADMPTGIVGIAESYTGLL